MVDDICRITAAIKKAMMHVLSALDINPIAVQRIFRRVIRALVGAVIGGLVGSSPILLVAYWIKTDPRVDELAGYFAILLVAGILLFLATPGALIGGIIGARTPGRKSNSRVPNGEDISTDQTSSKEPRLPAGSAQNRLHTKDLSDTEVNSYFSEEEMQGNDETHSA